MTYRRDLVFLFRTLVAVTHHLLRSSKPCILFVLAGVDLNNVGLGDLNVSSDIGSELTAAAATLDSVVGGGDTVAASLYHYGVKGLDDVRTKYQPESLKVCGSLMPSSCTREEWPGTGCNRTS